MPPKVSKNQRADTQQVVRRGRSFTGSPCPFCGAKSAPVRPTFHRCENGHVFVKKSGHHRVRRENKLRKRGMLR